MINMATCENSDLDHRPVAINVSFHCVFIRIDHFAVSSTLNMSTQRLRIRLTRYERGISMLHVGMSQNHAAHYWMDM